MAILEVSIKPEYYLLILSLTFYAEFGIAKFYNRKAVKVFVDSFLPQCIALIVSVNKFSFLTNVSLRTFIKSGF